MKVTATLHNDRVILKWLYDPSQSLLVIMKMTRVFTTILIDQRCQIMMRSANMVSLIIISFFVTSSLIRYKMLYQCLISN
jgi:hypothetical protein